jgi:exosortase
VLREGNILHLPRMPLFVAEACSGLRSLMALGTLGILFAYFFRKSWAERIVLIASTIPIAIIVNSFRVALTAVLSHYKPELAKGAMHTTEGFITFAMAFALLLAEATLISFGIKTYHRWKKAKA